MSCHVRYQLPFSSSPISRAMKNPKMKLLLAALAVLAIACAPLAAETPGKMSKQERANLKLVLDWWRAFQAGHAELVPEYFASDVIQHNPNFSQGAAVIQALVGR